jgi:hypothetical protein
MFRLKSIAFTVAALALSGTIYMAAQQKPAGPLVEVFKSPTCGCCGNWVEIMRKNGFTVHTTDLNDMTQIKKSRGVPADVQSCHTAVVNGYVVEGHVPPADVHRLLKEKPAVVGIAVGGMPIGSPGMETPYVKAEPYNVMSFDKNGAMRVYAKH